MFGRLLKRTFNRSVEQHWVNGVFLSKSMGDTNTKLRADSSPFWCLPPNPAAPGYAAAETPLSGTLLLYQQRAVTFGYSLKHFCNKDTLLRLFEFEMILTVRVCDKAATFTMGSGFLNPLYSDTEQFPSGNLVFQPRFRRALQLQAGWHAATDVTAPVSSLMIYTSTDVQPLNQAYR